MTAPAGIPRRPDLDALRAVAMVLGIALHASLAYVPGLPWPVHDARPAPLLVLFFLAVHGFRMPLFFLASGFFTAMLWKRRGPAAMLAQRWKRVFVPLLLASATLLPLFQMAMSAGPGIAAGGAAPDPADVALGRAIRARDARAVAAAIRQGADVERPDPEFRLPPLALAALVGDVDVARTLLDAGAAVDSRNGDGRTALHSAAFAGRDGVAALLLDRGADPVARSPIGDRPADSTRADEGTTYVIARVVDVALGDPAELRAGRGRVRALLADRSGEPDEPPPEPSGRSGTLDRARDAYRAWLGDDRFSVVIPPLREPTPLFLGTTFNYLWFLWFLCWLAVGFVVVAAVATRLRLPSVPPRLVTLPGALLWTIPLTLLPQCFMGLSVPIFGPDTSSGLLPQPHVLAYYALFFAWGALWFLADGGASAVGRRWGWMAAVAILLCFPAGLVTLRSPVATALPQVLFAWLMSFAAIGFFRWLVPTESPTWRWLSDSAYWLYLAHLPLLIVIQQFTRDWQIPGAVKFLLVTAATTGLLLASYRFLVRPTPLGTLLNGPRRQPEASRAPSRASS